MTFRLPPFLTLAALVASLLGSAPTVAADNRLRPVDGTTLATNTPTLAWPALDAERVEVWLDGRKVDDLPGWRTSYVPFPLSFGEHRWHVVAVRSGTPRGLG